MLDATLSAVGAVLRTDPSISGEEVKAILAILRRPVREQPQAEPEDRVMSRAEVAKLLHCTPRTVSIYAARGVIRPLRLGVGGRRASGYSARSVEAALAARC